MSKLTGLARALYFRNFQIQRNLNCRFISTSKKTDEATTTTINPAGQVSTEVPKDCNWDSYGFDNDSKEMDRARMHLFAFFLITIGMVCPAFMTVYAPSKRDWEQREAFLELRRREALGLPLIDKNFIDPSTIELPSDEELEGVEIII